MNVTDDTWISKNHPVRMICGLIAFSAALLAMGLGAIWLIDQIDLPQIGVPAYGPANLIERTFLDLAEMVERLK